MFPPCSMPSLPTIYSLSWRKWGSDLRGAVLQEAEAVWRSGVPPRSWGWCRRPVQLPGRAKKPSERWGRLRQACRRSSQDAERSG